LKTPVTIDRARIDYVDTWILFEGVKIGNPQGFPEGACAEFQKFFGDIEVSSLWERKSHFETVKIEFKELRIIRNQKGVFNLMQLGPVSSQKSDPSRQPSKNGSSVKRGAVQVDHLFITLQKVTYTDLSAAMPIQRSFELPLDHAEFNNVGGAADITRILVAEMMKKIALEGIKRGCSV
jgi:uncharacterized protein involved in outer membrane biogenesis